MKRFLAYFVTAACAMCVVSYNADAQKKKNEDTNLRVLYYNIQNGMWADQGNNFDTFVKWVNEKNPDICVWCEGETIYYPETTQTIENPEEKILPEGWPELAARYGHDYVWKSGHRDPYPQIITSKYPIENVLQSTGNGTDTLVYHGFGHAKVLVEGVSINLVTLHLYPFSYIDKESSERVRIRLEREAATKKYEDAVAAGESESVLAALKSDMDKKTEAHRSIRSTERTASTNAGHGNAYRTMEMKYIVEHTSGKTLNPAQECWIMCGDFNSYSHLDNWHYKWGDGATVWSVTKSIESSCPYYYDIVAEHFPGIFCRSTMGNSRIDFMYVTKPLLKASKKVNPDTDWFTKQSYSDVSKNFKIPSDHRPIIADFNLGKLK